MNKLEVLNSLIRKTGFELTRYNKGVNGVLRKSALLEQLQIDLVIDVGANTGIYAKEVRRGGYKGRIVSFEPLTDAFKVLRQSSNKDARWEAFHFALGSKRENQFINISANSHSSSFLDMADTHKDAEKTASYVNKQEIEIKTLDEIFDEIRGACQKIFLKIDTQGFELNVLKGALNSLKLIDTIQLELSLHSLYQGQPLYNELMDFLHSLGYKLIDIEPGFANLKTGTQYQFDGIFRRSDNGH